MPTPAHIALCLAALLAALPGCGGARVAPTEPAAGLPTSFSASGEAELPGEWWRVFEDPALSGLMDRALAQSPTLEAAWYRRIRARPGVVHSP